MTMRLLGWAGFVSLFMLLLLAVTGETAAAMIGLRMYWVLMGAAALLGFTPLVAMLIHLNSRAPLLSEEDKRMWRHFLVWGGPLTGCAYWIVKDRRISGDDRKRALLNRLG